MEKIKKKRSENWTSEEKDVLRQIISESAHIIENKSNKQNVNVLKNKEWKNMTTKFNEITGKIRNEEELKLAWKRMKLTAKANISSHRQQLYQTGGGEKPPSPSADDLSVMAIAPYDFIIETNDYDSDAVLVISEDANKNEKQPSPGPLLHQSENQVTAKESGEFTNHITRDNKKKRNSHKISQDARESIAESNMNFKKKSLEMLQDEHALNKEIAKLKIKKLELQIALLEKQLSQ